MKNFETDTQYEEAEMAQCLIIDRMNELMKTYYKPAQMIMEAMIEFTMADNEKMAEYVNENNMEGLGKFIYLKTYDFASMLAERQAEKEYEQGEL